MKRVKLGILFCCVFFLVLGLATTARSDTPELYDCRQEVANADADLVHYFTNDLLEGSLFRWNTPPELLTKNFSVTKEADYCTLATEAGITDLKQAVHDWVTFVRTEGYVLVKVPEVHIQNNWSPGAKTSTLTLHLTLSMQNFENVLEP